MYNRYNSVIEITSPDLFCKPRSATRRYQSTPHLLSPSTDFGAGVVAFPGGEVGEKVNGAGKGGGTVKVRNSRVGHRLLCCLWGGVSAMIKVQKQNVNVTYQLSHRAKPVKSPW